MVQAGRQTVALGLVDSFFGNLSYRLDGILYISQTSSALDELQGCIDPCPLDGSSSAALTASSELSAHRAIVQQTGKRAVLHAHPKFAVIMSLICDHDSCDQRSSCHRSCPHPRQVAGIPIVAGEVGTGRYGLCHTVPPALADNPGVIVYGHGVFSAARDDFQDALNQLLKIETDCRRVYFERLQKLRLAPCRSII
jgi:ribulose-5-phosphate 4-epimerase/fuculose-1-phosphate aldolase